MPDRFENRMSPEARQKQSDRLRQRHADGDQSIKNRHTLTDADREKAMAVRLAKKDRVGQEVAKAASEDSEAIINVFRDAIHPNQPMHVRLKAAEAYVKIANEYAKIELQAQVASAATRDREQLLDLLAGKLTDGPAAKIIRHRLEEETILDAEVVDDDESLAA